MKRDPVTSADQLHFSLSHDLEIHILPLYLFVIFCHIVRSSSLNGTVADLSPLNVSCNAILAKVVSELCPHITHLAQSTI